MRGDNSIEMSENQILKDLVYEYCKITSSEEYEKADRLVKDMNGQLESIKTEFKRLNITEMEVKKEEGECKIKFNIGKMERINTKALPLDIKEKYKAISDVWKKLVSYKRKD
jgi:hypothetical protein